MGGAPLGTWTSACTYLASRGTLRATSDRSAALEVMQGDRCVQLDLAVHELDGDAWLDVRARLPDVTAAPLAMLEAGAELAIGGYAAATDGTVLVRHGCPFGALRGRDLDAIVTALVQRVIAAP